MTSQARKKQPTEVVSFRLTDPDLRPAFAAKCAEDGVTQAKFISDVIKGYLEGRLKIICKPPKRPSYLVDSE